MADPRGSNVAPTRVEAALLATAAGERVADDLEVLDPAAVAGAFESISKAERIDEGQARGDALRPGRRVLR
jgi:hypothetical protein